MMLVGLHIDRLDYRERKLAQVRKEIGVVTRVGTVGSYRHCRHSAT